MDRPTPSTVTGFHGDEWVNGETYAWTRKDVALTVDGLDRTVPWSCTIRLRGARADASTLPEVIVTVDGVVSARVQTSNDFADVRVELPVRDRSPATVVTLTSSNTFVPPSDERALGVMVDRWACAPEGRWARAPLAAIVAAAVGGAAFGLATALTGLPALAGLGLLAGLAAVQAVPLAWEFGPFGVFPETAWHLAVALALLLGAGTALTSRLLGRPLSTPARLTACITVAGLYVKLLALLHPSKPIVDAVFHAHRLQWILDGNWFFTQPMPSGVRFPYAIGLYVFTAPLTLLTDDFVTLLRIVVSAAEATGGLLLYLLIKHFWKDRSVAAMAAGIFVVIPSTFEVVGNANMTNAFGQSVALAVLAVATLSPPAREQRGRWAGLTALTTFAFLCHISTFMLLGIILLVLAVLYRVMSRGEYVSQAWAVATAAVSAAGLAVALYYARFGEAFRSAARVSATGAENTGQTLPATPFAEKLSDATRMSIESIGWPIFVLAIAGAALLWRHRTRDRLTLAVMALVATWAAFMFVVVLAPIEQSFQRYAAEFISRAVLATYPAMVICAALGVVSAWRAGVVWRSAGAILLLAAAIVGGQAWLQWLR